MTEESELLTYVLQCIIITVCTYMYVGVVKHYK